MFGTDSSQLIVNCLTMIYFIGIKSYHIHVVTCSMSDQIALCEALVVLDGGCH